MLQPQTHRFTRRRISIVRRYPKLTRENAFGSLFREFALNLCPAVVDAVREKLKITSFSAGPPAVLPASAAHDADVTTGNGNTRFQVRLTETVSPSALHSGASLYLMQQVTESICHKLNSAITGVWSLGLSNTRGDLSIQHPVHLSASGFDVQIWSILRPRFR
jgi:hypothetical protein